MKHTMKRWSLWLSTIIASLCLVCAGVFSANVPDTSITASAATTYTITKLTPINANANSAHSFYVQATANNATSFNNADDWSTQFALVEGTGAGFAINGVPFTPASVKQPGTDTNFYLELGRAAVSGDILTIDGDFASVNNANKQRDVTFTFNGCVLTYNGSAWSTWSGSYIEPTLTGGTSTRLNFSNFARISTLNKGKGVLVNGLEASFSATNSSLTLTNAVNVGDIVHIGGIFNNRYAIVHLHYRWDGSAWSLLTGYNEIVSHIDTSGASASGFYIALNNHIGVDNWDAMSFTSDSRIQLNGEKLTNAKIQLVGASLYVNLGVSANSGDMLSINGTYTYGDLKVLFAPTHVLQYNGSTWTLLPGSSYALGELSVDSGTATVLNMSTDTRLPLKGGEAFAFVLGDGVAINGLAISNYTVKSIGDYKISIDGFTANVGDVLSLGGAFYYETKQIRYLLDTCYFKWDGSTWTRTTPYYTQTIDLAQVAEMHGTNFYMQLSIPLVFDDWGAFTLKKGEGFTLNEQKINAEIKATGRTVYVDLHTTAKEGDLLMIDGTYTYTQNGVTEEIVFARTQVLKFNGSVWVPQTETLYQIGALIVNSPSNNGSASTRPDHLYTLRADGGALPVQNWDVAFTLESGAGVKVNNTPVSAEVKSTDAGLWVGLAQEVQKGQIVTISGTYVCTAANARYVIKNSTFRWTGSLWEIYDLVTYNVGKLCVDSINGTIGVYLAREDGKAFEKTDGSWTEKLTYSSGIGITLAGSSVMDDIKIPGTMYVGFGKSAKVGDVLVIGGTFENKVLKAQYVIEESRFVWTGAAWVVAYANDQLAAYDVVSLVNLGQGLSIAKNNAALDGSGFVYTPSAENTTGSVKFRFTYASPNTSAGAISVRLRGGAWDGVHFRIIYGGIEYVDEGKAISFSNNTNYLVELAAINTADGKVWSYIMVDGVIVAAKAHTGFAHNQNSVSIYMEASVANGTTLGDPDHVSVTYGDAFVEYAAKNSVYTIADVAMSDAFIAWGLETALYQAGATFELGNANVSFHAVDVDFVLKYGAAIRLAETADESGIRFTGMINTADAEGLAKYGITVEEFGMLIMPNDYLAENQAPNLTDFEAGKKVLQIPNTTYTDTIGDYTVYYSAMKTVKVKNYARNFAGRGYMIIRLANGETMTLYTPFSSDNVRSIRTVAQAFKVDDSEPQEGEIRYNTITEAKKTIVDAYADSPDYQSSSAQAATVSATLSQVEEGYEAAYVVNASGKKYSKMSSVAQRKE